MEAVADSIPAAATGSKANTTHRAFIRTHLLSQSPEGYNSLCQVILTAELPKYDQIKCALLVIAGEEDKTATIEGVNDIIDRYVQKMCLELTLDLIRKVAKALHPLS